VSRSPERSEGEEAGNAQGRLRRRIPETLRGVHPERDSSVASLPQNDRKLRAQGDMRIAV